MSGGVSFSLGKELTSTSTPQSRNDFGPVSGEDQSRCVHYKVIAGIPMMHMKNLKTVAAGAAIAGALGMAALGVGSGVASADPGWGHGRWDPGYGGRGWGPPPPAYGYGGYDGGYGGYGGPPCITGPFGFVHLCT
jgi:hypothetical protein